jgi:hypothetical protein
MITDIFILCFCISAHITCSMCRNCASLSCDFPGYKTVGSSILALTSRSKYSVNHVNKLYPELVTGHKSGSFKYLSFQIKIKT